MENVFDIKKNQGLNFILSKTQRSGMSTINEHEVALLIHLYYVDTIEKYIQYIKNVPEKVDLFFTISSDEIEKALSEKLKGISQNCRFIYKENRGRDISALLVAARKELLNYQYIGFIHDKKAKKEYHRKDIEEWIYCLWENMLGSEVYIENIIYKLKEENSIGLLTPPIPIMEHFDFCYANTWKLNYHNVNNLAKKLLIECDLDEKKPPIALGTVFWAKRSAIEKLLRFDWKYSDFDMEPLADDGKISHAIERILPFVAQDAGLYTGWVMTSKYAAKQFEKQNCTISTAFDVLRRMHGIYSVKQATLFDEYIDELSSFCKRFPKVYIYGAGYNGKKCMRELLDMGIKTECFLVSQRDNNPNQIWGIDVRIFADMVSDILNSKAGIIIAVKEDNIKEIQENILQLGIGDNQIYIRDNRWAYD